MKHIRKTNQPEAFVAWKAKRQKLKTSTTFKNLHGEVKKSVKDSLMNEQGRICCYCECLLTENDSHIEHFWPKEHFPARALDYQNMMCSCMNERQKSIPLHCGHLKGDWYDPQMPCPLDPTTQDRFFVEGNGNIRPTYSNDVIVQEMIDQLDLNSREMQDKRKKAIDGFLEGLLPTEDFRTAVAKQLKRRYDGTYTEFWSAIRDLIRSLPIT